MSGWCAPTIIYAFISVIAIIANTSHILEHPHQNFFFGKTRHSKEVINIVMTVVNVIIAILYTYLLYYLCSKGLNFWAWFALIAKLLLGILIVLIVVVYIVKHPNELHRDIQQEREQFYIS